MTRRCPLADDVAGSTFNAPILCLIKYARSGSIFYVKEVITIISTQMNLHTSVLTSIIRYRIDENNVNEMTS